MAGTGALPTTSPKARRGILRRHPWRLGVSLLIAVVAVVLLTGSLRYAFRSHPGAKSVDSAVEQFRSNASTPRVPSDFTRPAAGVYTARGHGTERISFPPNTQVDGAVMPVTVRAVAGGCWAWRIDYNTAHWHEYDFCPRGTGVVLTGDRNSQSWDFGVSHVANLGTFTYDPPSPTVVESARVGESFPNDSTGTNTAVTGTSTASGSATVAGVGELDVGGTRVRAVHQHRVQTLTGSQRGRVDEDWWFASGTGLPLQVRRSYTLRSASPLGDITYTESGAWKLDSLRART